MRSNRHALPAALALAGALFLAACTGTPPPEIGDPTGAPADAIPPARMLTNMASFMDGERARIEAELTNVGTEENGWLQVFVLGAGQQVELKVASKYKSQIDALTPGDDFVTFGTIGIAGQEPFQRTVIVVR